MFDFDLLGSQFVRNHTAGDRTEELIIFGSVTTRMVADELAAKDIKIEHSRITIDPPIKTLGSFEADVKLHAEVTAKIKIWVVRG